MALQVVDFPHLTFDENNPFLTGLQKTTSIAGQLLQNQNLNTANQYQASTLQQQLQAMQLQNAYNQVRNQYAEPMTQADLAYKQAQTPYLTAETANRNKETQWYDKNASSLIASREAGIPLTKAQTAHLNAETQNMPLENIFKANQQLQQQSRFGGAYQLAKGLQEMSPATRAVWIADNQEKYSQMLADLGNKQNNNLLTPEVLNKYLPQVASAVQPPQQQAGLQQQIQQLQQGGQQQPQQQFQQPGMQQMPQQRMMQQQAMQQQPSGQYMPGVSAMPNQMQAQEPAQQQNMSQQLSAVLGNKPQQNTFTGSSPEQIERLRRASEISANNYLITKGTQGQLEGALQVGQMFNSPLVQDQATNAAEYAGALGKGKSAAAAFSQNNPESYEKYIAFKNVTMPLILNRIKQLDKLGATDSQREIIENMYSKTLDSLTSNPKQFIQQFNILGQTLDQLSNVVQNSATPLGHVNRIENFKPIGGSQTTNTGSSKNDPLGIR